MVLYKEQMFLKLLRQWGKISDEVRSSIFSKFINKCQCTCLAHLKIKPKQRCFDLILSILEVHHKSSTGLCLAFWMVKWIKNSLKYLSFRTKVYDQQIENFCENFLEKSFKKMHLNLLTFSYLCFTHSKLCEKILFHIIDIISKMTDYIYW